MIAVPPLVVLVLPRLPEAIDDGVVLGISIVVPGRRLLLLLLLLHGASVLGVLIARPSVVAYHLVALVVHAAVGLEGGVHQHHLALGSDVRRRLLVVPAVVRGGGHGHHDRARLSRHLHHLHRLQDLPLPIGGGHGHVENLRLLLGYDGHGDVLRLLNLLLQLQQLLLLLLLL